MMTMPFGLERVTESHGSLNANGTVELMPLGPNGLIEHFCPGAL
jgi:hypothetical protein